MMLMRSRVEREVPALAEMRRVGVGELAERMVNVGEEWVQLCGVGVGDAMAVRVGTGKV